MNDQELYNEEQLKNLKEIKEQLAGSVIVPMPNQSKKMKAEIINKVSAEIVNKIEIDDKPFEALSDDIQQSLTIFTQNIVKAIVDSSKEPINEITVKNIADAKVSEVSITNFKQFEDRITELTKAVINNQPIVNVEKQVVEFPTQANKPIAVRLSDGKSFYNAIANAVSGGMANFVNTENRGVPVKLTGDGRVPVELGISPSIDIGDVQIKNASNVVINPATEEKQDAEINILTSKISTLNSTNVQLGINQTFTGTWEDVTNYAEVIVSVYTTHTSVTDGLKVEWSMNGTDVQGSDVFTITASSSRTFSFPAQTKYFRVRYTNDGVATTTFQLQSVLKIRASKGSSHRLKDNLNQEDDAIVTKSQIVGFTTGGGGGTDLINVKVTPSGALTTHTTISGGDPLIKYKIADTDDASATKYYGFTDVNGNWYILRESSSTYRYSTGTTNYATNWTNRASLTYNYLFNVTVN